MLQQIHKVSCADLFPLSNTHSFASVDDPIRDLIQFRNNKNVQTIPESVTVLSVWFTINSLWVGSAFLLPHTVSKLKSDDVRKTCLTALSLFRFSCDSASTSTVRICVNRGGGKLQLAGHSTAVEGVCHIQLKNNSESLLNYMLMIFCSTAKLLQTLALAKRQKPHQHLGDFFSVFCFFCLCTSFCRSLAIRYQLISIII